MHGKICLVTGGTNGIGKSTALGLARIGANVQVSIDGIEMTFTLNHLAGFLLLSRGER